MTPRVTRLAPSPTGALHLGNARTFLINWAIARRSGWEVLMRVEDLDGPRIKPGAVEETLDILRWLGLDWDGEVMVQSRDLAPYREALERLAERGEVYRCDLTRREIEAAASAPHAGDHETVFPAALRPPRAETSRWRFSEEETNYRFVVPESVIEFDDAVHGRVRRHLAEEVGDFVVWTKGGTPAYQLAVVVDDARQGVTDVIRGDDLLSSAARQMLLYDALELRPPRWWHLPLVLGPDGRRLARRHAPVALPRARRAGGANHRAPRPVVGGG